MNFIDFSYLGAQLEKCENRDEHQAVLPRGLERETFDLITRVLAAEKPSDIKDVPTEKLVGIYSQINSYLSLYEEDSLINSNLISKANSYKSASSLLKRRVL